MPQLPTTFAKWRPHPGYGKAWEPSKQQAAYLELHQKLKRHMQHPDTRHVMSWHEKDMASLKKESFTLNPPNGILLTAVSH